MAQAVGESVGLTRTCQLPIERAVVGPLRWPWSGRNPDLAIVIDSSAPAIVSAVRAIKRRWKQIRVLVVGLGNSQAAILSCVEAGADGLFMADEPLERLPAAVEDLLAGRFRPPPNLLKIWAAEFKDSPRPGRSAAGQQPAKLLSLPATGGRPRPSAAAKPSPWAGDPSLPDGRPLHRNDR